MRALNPQAEMEEAVTKLNFEYTQAKQTLKLQADEKAAAIAADTQAAVTRARALGGRKEKAHQDARGMLCAATR